jgi:hypothetical protein
MDAANSRIDLDAGSALRDRFVVALVVVQRHC